MQETQQGDIHRMRVWLSCILSVSLLKNLHTLFVDNRLFLDSLYRYYGQLFRGCVSSGCLHKDMSCGKVILFALYYQFSDYSALLYIQVMKTGLVLYLYLISHFPAFNLSVSSSSFNLSKNNKSIKDTIEGTSLCMRQLLCDSFAFLPNISCFLYYKSVNRNRLLKKNEFFKISY